MAAPSQFRLSAESLADLDALAASNGGTRTPALREAIAYWRRIVEEAGRTNADALSPEEWTLLAHTGDPSDMEIPGDDEAGAAARDWCVWLATSLAQMHDGREVVLQSHRDEARAARKLAKKIAGWGIVRGYALYAALRYFWRRPEAGIAACAAPEVWMTPVAREGKWWLAGDR